MRYVYPVYVLSSRGSGLAYLFEDAADAERYVKELRRRGEVASTQAVAEIVYKDGELPELAPLSPETLTAEAEQAWADDILSRPPVGGEVPLPPEFVYTD